MLLKKRIPASCILNNEKYDLVFVLIVSLTALFIAERYKKLLPEMPLTIPAFINDANVTTIARAIEINIKQLIKETDVSQPSQPEKFYSL